METTNLVTAVFKLFLYLYVPNITITIAYSPFIVAIHHCNHSSTSVEM